MLGWFNQVTSFINPFVMSTSRAAVERSWFSRVFAGTESILPFVPKPVKYLVLLVFLLNYKSWPFVWHIRVWYWALSAKFRGRQVGPKQYYHDLGLDLAAHRALIASRSPADPVLPLSSTATIAKDLTIYKDLAPERGLKRTSKGLRKVGRLENPLLIRDVVKFYAGLDDCDYNMHLSNSSYAKNLDVARMKACVEFFSPIFPAGVHMALAASHYHFAKEIPVLSEYEVRMGMMGFEEKWIYLVSEFVTYPKSNKKSKSSASKAPRSFDPIPSISQPGSGTSTPTTNGNGNGVIPPKSAVRADGSVLHCLAISTYCFKMGRITVPTRVALSFAGFGKPENWERAERLLKEKDFGRKWLAGGFKDEPEPVGLEFDVHQRGKPAAEAEGNVDEKGAEFLSLLKRAVEKGESLKAGLDGMKELMAETASL